MNQSNQEQNKEKVEKKHNIFYKTTNLISGKFYYGIHSTNNLDDGYIGSGRIIKDSLKKYRKDDYIREIIADYPTRKEASDHERIVVTVEMTNDPLCLNLKTGGDNENMHSEETRKNWSKTRKGKNCGESNPFFGKKHSEETKMRISGINNHNFGKRLTEEQKERRREVVLRGENHPNFGKPVSEEAIQKLRNVASCQPCIILDVVYHSMSEAARHLEISQSSVRSRIISKNIKYKNWNYYE